MNEREMGRDKDMYMYIIYFIIVPYKGYLIYIVISELFVRVYVCMGVAE